MSVGQELASVNIADMITALGIGIAQAQFELDKTSAAVARMMSGTNPEDRVLFGGESLSLIELGFTPTFYQFIESTIEVKVVVNMNQSISSEEKSKTKTTSNELKGFFWWGMASGRTSATTKTVDAKYAKKYDYSVEGSSLVRTKLVPVPPPAILEERIRNLMDQEAQVRYERALRKTLAQIRDGMVTDIADWAVPASVVIGSVGDLSGYFLDDHRAYQQKVEAFPDILSDRVINTAFTNRLNTYRANLNTRWLTATTNYTPDPANSYRDFLDLQAEVLSQNPDLAEELRVNRDLLESPGTQTTLKTKLTAYKTSLQTTAETALANWTLPVGQLFRSKKEMLEQFFSEHPGIETRVALHRDILESASFTGKVQTKIDAYKAALATSITTKLNNEWNAPLNGNFSSVTDVQDLFFDQHANLDARFSELASVLQVSAVRTAFSRQYNFVAILAFVQSWEPPAEADTKAKLRTAFFAEVDARSDLDKTGIKSKIEGHPNFIKRIDELNTTQNN